MTLGTARDLSSQAVAIPMTSFGMLMNSIHSEFQRISPQQRRSVRFSPKPIAAADLHAVSHPHAHRPRQQRRQSEGARVRSRRLPSIPRRLAQLQTTLGRYILTLNRLRLCGVKDGVASKPAWILGKTAFGTTGRMPKDSRKPPFDSA
jgi:hypothetical protein